MTDARRKITALLIPLLLFTTISTSINTEVFAQPEMTPEWTIENGDEFARLAISADGKYIAATTNNTNKLYLLRGDESLWNSTIDHVHSLAMSADGNCVAVGAESDFYFFNVQNSIPQLKYPLDYGTSMVATSADGNVTVVGTTPSTHNNTETKLYLFEKGNFTPTWNSTVLGILESLSTSDDGEYITVGTSKPGVLYLFAKEQATPLWSHEFGERCGSARISNNGAYIVATGGNETDANMRIYGFGRLSPSANYVKIISELPSSQGLSVSANGSIFAASYAKSNNLILFNLELPPYGYGPGSVLNISLPSPRISMSMSIDGRHIAVGAVNGIFMYEYYNGQLTLKKQYTVNKPFINDVVLSANGRYVIAAATQFVGDTKHSAIYLFDNFKESLSNTINPWLQVGTGIIIVASISLAAGYVIRRRQGGKTQKIHSSPVKSKYLSKAFKYLAEKVTAVV